MGYLSQLPQNQNALNTITEEEKANQSPRKQQGGSMEKLSDLITSLSAHQAERKEDESDSENVEVEQEAHGQETTLDVAIAASKQSQDCQNPPQKSQTCQNG